MKNMFDRYFLRKKMYYTPCLGLTGTQIITYNEYIHTNAKIFFQILDKINLEYYVFAGTSIGYVRNKSNIPWVDDYDIIVFEQNINFFEEKIIDILKKNGFICSSWINEKGTKAGYRIFSQSMMLNRSTNELEKGTLFQCDVFYSKINENNIVKNLCGYGLYNHKNITYDMIYPSQRLQIDDITLPFFNKMEEDVLIEYGDVINECCIHVNHKRTKFIYEHYTKVYQKFNEHIDRAKKNTLNYITKNNNYKYENNCTFKKEMEFVNVLDALRYINLRNVKTLFILDEKFLKYCISIKHYFPEINIIFYMFHEINIHNIIFLNYVDIIRFSNENIKNIYEDTDILFIKKPIYEYINVITFGTYDLFHIGHTNILRRSRNLGNKLIVGISSDELNIKKGKHSINNTEKRISDVLESNFADEYFIEEFLEEKNNYILQHNANLLTMGDDWKDKFDWVSCPCIYFPRTPEISTTLLKEKMDIIKKKEDVQKNENNPKKINNQNKKLKKFIPIKQIKNKK
jgi:glycerol-3-phosphate cytidylyltransferase